VNEFKNQIYAKFKDKYEMICNNNFNEFYESVIAQLDISNNIKSEIKILLRKSIRPTKRRWLKIIINDKESNFNKEIDLIKLSFEKAKNGEVERTKLINLYGVDNIEEYRVLQLKNLNKWVNDDKYFLTDFKYLKDLKLKSILSGFKNDLNLYYLINLDANITNKNVTKVPAIFSTIPIDTTCRIDYLSTAQKNGLIQDFETNSMPTLNKLISLEGSEQEEILMKLEKKTYLEIKNGGNPDNYLDTMTQIALLKSIKYLNSFDTKIVTYYYTHFEHIVTGTPIDKSLYEILTDLNLPKTSKYTEYIENSLAKLGSINMTYTIEGNRLYGNLLSCMIYTENNVKRAKVFLGAILQNLVIKDSAFEYDKEVYNNLSDTSKQLAVWLQKRRYNLALNKEGAIRIEEIYISEFSNAIYFNTRRADRRRNTILSSLEELKSSKLIVFDFNYNKKTDAITMEYIALTTMEKNKLGILTNDLIEQNIDSLEPNKI